MTDGFTKQPVGPKAKDQLGPKVEISTKKLGKRPESAAWLEEAGKAICPAGQSYIGTIALHLLKPSVGGMELQFATHITAGVGDISEAVVAHGMSQHNLAVLDHYGKKPKTRKI